jgi:hypothetical protein
MSQHEFDITKGPLAGKKVTWNQTEPSDGPPTVGRQVTNRAYEILDSIVSKVCRIGPIAADIYMADLGCYTIGDEKETKRILDKITEKYGVDREYLECLKSYPIGLIALYTLDK